MIIRILEDVGAAFAVVLILCVIAVWSLFFADFDGGSERPSCKAGSVAAIFTDCEVEQ